MDDYSSGMLGLGFLGGSLMVFILVLIAALIIPLIFYLISLQKAYNALPEAKRPFPGGLVWLALIPFVGWAWLAVAVIMASAYLRTELRARSIIYDAGLGVGIAFVACSVVSWLVVPGIAALVLWIIHWVMIVKATRMLTTPPVTSSAQAPQSPVI